MDLTTLTSEQEDIIRRFTKGEPVVYLCRERGLDLRETLRILPIRMPQHAISIRHVFDFWPSESFAKIFAAQAAHDAGRVDVCQGKVNNHFVLYSIPRKQRATKRRPWFTAPQVPA